MKYRLGDICTIIKGATGIMKAIPGPYPMIALGETDKTHNEFQFDTKAVIIPLVSSTGHGHASMKRVKYCEGKFALGNILCAVIPNDESFVLAKYLHIYLHWNREELLVSQMKGMANVSLPMNRIADVIVKVPSIEKQREIIKLEKQLVEKEIEADKIFATQLTLLENLNQAILQEAVQGKLVPQDDNDEPASELLKRIRAEKAKSGKKEKPLPPIKPEEIPFEIPESWVWCKGNAVANYIDPQPSHRTPPVSMDGIPYVAMSDINKNGSINFHSARKVSKMVFEEHRNRYQLQTGDFIFGKIGTIGKPVKLSEPFNYTLSANIILIQPDRQIIDEDFLFYFLSSPIADKILRDKKSTTSYPVFGMGKARDMIIPLPPLSEQKRIVAEIEKQLAKTKQLKEHILANQQATEQLLKALLHQAFEVKEAEEINS